MLRIHRGRINEIRFIVNVHPDAIFSTQSRYNLVVKKRDGVTIFYIPQTVRRISIFKRITPKQLIGNQNSDQQSSSDQMVVRCCILILESENDICLDNREKIYSPFIPSKENSNCKIEKQQRIKTIPSHNVQSDLFLQPRHPQN